MKNVPKRRIQEIMSKIECPERFACYESGFQKVCTRRISEIPVRRGDKPNRCDKNPDGVCEMSVSSAGNYCCRCPLRLYVATYLRNVAALEGPTSASSADGKDLAEK